MDVYILLSNCLSMPAGPLLISTPNPQNLMACHDEHRLFRPSELVPFFALAGN